jgi:hypothetical protein
MSIAFLWPAAAIRFVSYQYPETRLKILWYRPKGGGEPPRLNTPDIFFGCD